MPVNNTGDCLFTHWMARWNNGNINSVVSQTDSSTKLFKSCK